MGKGDKKSKKGKIFSKSTGNSRPNSQKLRKLKEKRNLETKPAAK